VINGLLDHDAQLIVPNKLNQLILIKVAGNKIDQ
jgi:hypothetical protein